MFDFSKKVIISKLVKMVKQELKANVDMFNKAMRSLSIPERRLVVVSELPNPILRVEHNEYTVTDVVFTPEVIQVSTYDMYREVPDIYIAQKISSAEGQLIVTELQNKKMSLIFQSLKPALPLFKFGILQAMEMPKTVLFESIYFRYAHEILLGMSNQSLELPKITKKIIPELESGRIPYNR